jgi:hypothetical protein
LVPALIFLYRACVAASQEALVGIVTERAPFTFFEARSINFAIVVYAMINARRSSTCIEAWDHGGQHGQESEEGEGKEEDRQEEKEVGLADLLF